MDDERETKLIIQYLLILREDKVQLKNMYLKVKTNNLKKKLTQIMQVAKQEEVSLETYATNGVQE